MVIHGARVSLLIGLSAALVSIFIGVSIGALAGFYRGFVEEILIRVTNFQVLPTLLFSMVIVALFGASLTMITVAIGVVAGLPLHGSPGQNSFALESSSTLWLHAPLGSQIPN